MLLYWAGQRVREICESLADTGESDDCAAAVAALNAHFTVKPNATFLKHMFRKTTQSSSETVAQFIARLRKSADGCNFNNVDTEIVDQVVTGCYSNDLRGKLLDKGSKLDLKKMQEIAANFEAVSLQSKEMKSNPNSHINHVKSNPKPKVQHQHKSFSGVECYRCGKKGHIGSSSECLARGKTCRKCGGKDHFELKCRSKKAGAKGCAPHRQKHKANLVESTKQSDTEGESEYAFICSKSSKGFYRFDVHKTYLSS